MAKHYFVLSLFLFLKKAENTIARMLMMGTSLS